MEALRFRVKYGRQTSSHQLIVEVTGAQYPWLVEEYLMEGSQKTILLASERAKEGSRGWKGIYETTPMRYR